jgi:hemin uptake protein HemP
MLLCPDPMSELPSESPSTALPGAPLSAPLSAPRSVPSSELFRGLRELRIEHEGEQYTLRLTRLNKLILTK